MKKYYVLLFVLFYASELSINAKQPVNIEKMLQNNNISIELFFPSHGMNNYAGSIWYSNGKWDAGFDADYGALKFLDATISKDVFYISYLYTTYHIKGKPSYIDYEYPGKNTITITREQLVNYITNKKEKPSMEIQIDYTKYSTGSIKGIVITNNLRVRSKPSLQSDTKVIGKLAKFDDVFIIDATEKEIIDGLKAPWYKVQFNNDSIGWVFGGFVKLYLWKDEIEQIKRAFAEEGSEYSN